MHIRDIYLKYKKNFDNMANEEKKIEKLCELNILT
jgi:hypothetical protein